MNTKRKTTPTLNLAKALRVIADDLSGDGAPIASVALHDAADRLLALEWKRVVMDETLRQIASSGKKGTRDRRNARATLHFLESQMTNDAPPTTCDWKHDSVSGVWNGTCGVAWELTSGTPSANSMRFCPNCGGVLKPEVGL